MSDNLSLAPERAAAEAVAPSPQRPTFRQALGFWLELGFISFGGPAGQIAIMHRELVERRRWIDEPRFLHALNFCMLLPGPEAQQLAIYLGWLLHGIRGGVVAGTLFVLPSALILWALSWSYVVWRDVPLVDAVLHGLQAAVVAIVAAAVMRIGRRALHGPLAWFVAAASFVAIALLALPFPLIIAAAALIGLATQSFAPGSFAPATGHGSPAGATTAMAEAALSAGQTRNGPGRVVRLLAVHLGLWFAPIALAASLLGSGHLLVQQGLFFSKAALVTFGGAYAVLPYVAQQTVERFAWLSGSQMMVGMALAETTPGPLIMVLQFVGFVGAWNHPAPFSPLIAATLGAAITTWTTFVPCFLFVLLGAPWVERLRGSPKLSAALGAITAAVVGVVLALALWFGRQVLFPATGSMDLFALAVAVLAFFCLTAREWSIIAVVGAAALAGLLQSHL